MKTIKNNSIIDVPLDKVLTFKKGIIVQVVEGKVSILAPYSTEGKMGFLELGKLFDLGYNTIAGDEDAVLSSVLRKRKPVSEAWYFDTLSEFCATAMEYKWTLY